MWQIDKAAPGAIYLDQTTPNRYQWFILRQCAVTLAFISECRNEVLQMQPQHSWISTVYMYQVEDLPSGRRQLASSSASARSEPTGAPWWPVGVGPESENAGNVLILASLPATVPVGVRLVTYGRDFDTLSLWMVADATGQELFRSNEKVQFSPLHASSRLGVASLRYSHRPTFFQAGLYWLGSAFPNSPVTQLPLYVEKRSDWAPQSSH